PSPAIFATSRNTVLVPMSTVAIVIRCAYYQTTAQREKAQRGQVTQPSATTMCAPHSQQTNPPGPTFVRCTPTYSSWLLTANGSSAGDSVWWPPSWVSLVSRTTVFLDPVT